MLSTRIWHSAAGVLAVVALSLGVLGWGSTALAATSDWIEACELQTGHSVNVTTAYPVRVTGVWPDPLIVTGTGTWFVVDHFISSDQRPLWDGTFHWIEVSIFDLTGRRVATITRQNDTRVWWSVGTLRNGAYIYVATVSDTWGRDMVRFGPFRDFVYIQRR